MTLILDMNLSPKLVDMLAEQQIDAKHWCMIGSFAATDTEIMTYAKKNNCIVVTYDLDFTAILSVTHDCKPSVIQIRKHRLDFCFLAKLLSVVTRRWADDLSNGAVLTIDAEKLRVRLLPLI